MKQRVYSILVDNSAGVLSRVASLFSRRGYNIDSLTVGVTADPAFSRMTIVCSGDDSVLEQIRKQLAKLVDVRDIKVLEPGASVTHELMMVKLTAKDEDRQNVLALAEIFKRGCDPLSDFWQQFHCFQRISQMLFFVHM